MPEPRMSLRDNRVLRIAIIVITIIEAIAMVPLVLHFLEI